MKRINLDIPDRLLMYCKTFTGLKTFAKIGVIVEFTV